MNIKEITPFVSVFGVLLGFLLAWAKEIFQNKPKLKFNVKEASVKKYEDKITVDALISVYNIGKAPTGIMEIVLKFYIPQDNKYIGNIYVGDKYVGDYNPNVNLLFNDKTLKGRGSFNVPAGTIETFQLSYVYLREPFTEYNFENNLDDIRCDFIAKDIYNKEHQILKM
ncbi:hypothetical protein FB550_102397 [Neobacillus bataviensis]|uniref:Uncharacterized protein n=1 Tax=Neobacillus bataviensis TaxID=220685 RepID=A0A561DSL6_9BACI|nr:hypothetical protein [Neobacillus bataviensis]TWE06375.1 hypothetical protein FB550_102397 [Neobacillus bataviensis]